MYSLRYLLGNEIFVLKCVIIDGTTAVFVLYNACKGTSSHVTFEIRDTIPSCGEAQTSRRLVDMMPRVDVHIVRIREELVMPVAGCSNCGNESPSKKPDPRPMPRSEMEFNCLPNMNCNWPAQTAFSLPNRGLLVPTAQGCCDRPERWEFEFIRAVIIGH